MAKKSKKGRFSSLESLGSSKGRKKAFKNIRKDLSKMKRGLKSSWA